MRKAKGKEQQAVPCVITHIAEGAECNKGSKKGGGEVSGAKLRCFSMCFLISTVLVTSILLIGNRVYWFKFPVTEQGFLNHDRNKLFGRQKNMGC